MDCFWLKVLVWNMDWFVPKCGMREEALRRSYIILIITINKQKSRHKKIVSLTKCSVPAHKNEVFEVM